MDKRHLTVLSWMVTALLSSQSLNQARWEPFVQSRAEQANSYQRRWNRFCQNGRVAVEKIYIPLILKPTFRPLNCHISCPPPET